MKQVVIFAGTTEGRELSGWLCERGWRHIVCVATEYGAQLMEPHPLVTLSQKRMDAAEMADFFREKKTELVVDATHPYAQEVTKNLQEACRKTGVEYLRCSRELGEKDEDAVFFSSHEDCARALCALPGQIMLTTGTKDLNVYCRRSGLRKRLVVRVLPGTESLAQCEAAGLLGRQIIAAQGPFSESWNEAMLKEYNVSCLVTKQSGAAGGFFEKLAAAKKLQIPLYVVRPKLKEQQAGMSIEQVKQQIAQRAEDEKEEPGGCVPKESETKANAMTITLVGAGMGAPKMLTVEGAGCVADADVVFGAPRLLKQADVSGKKLPYYLAKDILPVLKKQPPGARVVILFSGDTGCFSGCRKLYEAIQREIAEGRLCACVRILPGISAVSYLAAALGETWEDAAIFSIHGKREESLWKLLLWEHLAQKKKVYVLLSGTEDVMTLCRLLMEYESACGRKGDGASPLWEMKIGCRLSEATEEILSVTAEEIVRWLSDGGSLSEYPLFAQLLGGPCICLLRHTIDQTRRLIPAVSDGAFCRGRVPMTKEEIRLLSVAKLHLHRKACCYDIGSGTGSLAVEMAALSYDICVYAIEKRDEAVGLLMENKEKFALPNMTVVKGEAPEAFAPLPVPTHAIIGGSGGRLTEILKELEKKNPSMRVVLSAVSLETLQSMQQIQHRFFVSDFELVQIGVTRTKQLGSYHMLQAENPVWICSFTFGEENENT